MTDDQMRKALDCCCCSDCAKCVLSQYKFDDEYHAKFICMVAESSWRKNLCMALKKTIMKNPDRVQRVEVALWGMARVGVG